METSLRFNIIPEIIFGVLNASQGFLIFAFHVSLSKSKRQIWEEFFRVKSNKLRKDFQSVSKFFNANKKENEMGIESAFKPVIKSKSNSEVEEENIEQNKEIIETNINDKDSTQKLESDKLFTICQQFEQTSKNRSGSCSSVTTTTKTVKQINEDRRFVPIGAYKKCASFLTTSKSIHDSLETNVDVKTNCSTPEIDHNSINYFSDDISARISRLNESLRRIKNTEKKSLSNNKFSPVSFKLDDLSTLFYDQL
jgi:hypothetical protein